MMNQLDKKKNKEPESSGLHIRDPTQPEDGENFDIIWSGESSICDKKLIHYKAFTKNGTIVSVNSFAFILASEGGHHIGYIEDMYESQRKKKMVKVRWFHKSEELYEIISKPNPHELIITSQIQYVSAECIDGLATILTPKHYTQCMNLVSQDFSYGIYMCSKQIKNDKVLSFPVSKLRGYDTQAIFSLLNSPIGVNKNNQETSIQQEEEKEEDGAQGFKDVITISNDEVEKKESFCVGEEIEVLSHDSGIRGCWYRCKILKISEKRFKVLYLDLEDAEGPGNLKEWVVAYRIAPPDKLGMRYLGRTSIRPSSPMNKESSDDGFSIGTAVDAWWCDGWWEGVVVGIGINIHGNNDFHVYFPGENKLQYIEKVNLRASKEWDGNRWIEIKPMPDIVSFVASNVKVQKRSSVGGTSSENGANNVAKKKKKALVVEC